MKALGLFSLLATRLTGGYLHLFVGRRCFLEVPLKPDCFAPHDASPLAAGLHYLQAGFEKVDYPQSFRRCARVRRLSCGLAQLIVVTWYGTPGERLAMRDSLLLRRRDRRWLPVRHHSFWHTSGTPFAFSVGVRHFPPLEVQARQNERDRQLLAGDLLSLWRRFLWLPQRPAWSPVRHDWSLYSARRTFSRAASHAAGPAPVIGF